MHCLSLSSLLLRLDQLEQLPLHQRTEHVRCCQQHTSFLLGQPTLAQALDSATAAKLRARVAEQGERQAALEQQLQQVKGEREQTQQQLQLALQAVQQQQAELTATLTQLQTKVEAAKANCQAAVTAGFALPVSRLSLEQAHTMCATVLGMDLPYTLFTEHGIDGAALVAMGDYDFQHLFGIEQLGLRHRLVHCIQRAAHTPAPELLATDFAAAEAQLQAWLTEQGRVPAAHQELIAQARFDMTTCGDVTANMLGMAGIPFAARKPLLMLLQHAKPALPSVPSTTVIWKTEMQRAVLEQVLHENTDLAVMRSWLPVSANATLQATISSLYMSLTCFHVTGSTTMAVFKRMAKRRWVPMSSCCKA